MTARARKMWVGAGLAGIAFGALASSGALAQGYPAVTLFETDKTILGEALVYPPGKARVTASIVTLAPGEATIRHRHGAPFFVYVLEGEISVDYGAQGTRVYKAGDSFMEAMAVEHAGTNKSAAPVRLLAVSLGADGVKNLDVDKR